MFNHIYTIKTNNTNYTIATLAQHRTIIVYTLFDRMTQVNERYYNRHRRTTTEFKTIRPLIAGNKMHNSAALPGK